ncbi:DNA-binding protein [Streptomyces sp. NPDC048595]|uniref:nSTAND1 domain-containing NTPase n=1 Tax=Streptomyces sp. NPDC048595 TaxID=3365576 RepID=UPI00371A1841
MGRPEKAIDPQDGPVQRLAYELRKLRDEAGTPGYRAMARRAGYSASVLSTAAAGERLPSLPVFLAYVRACGGNEEEWQHRWEQVDEELAAQPRPDEEDGESPYRGLARFEPRDAELFFGRGEMTERLEQMARSHRVCAVVGASGSGKSSLLRAGLIPRLRATGQEAGEAPAAVRVLTPGTHPMGHAERLKPADGPQDTWLLVDQLEELFTLCTDPGEREAFLDCLLAAREDDSRLRVILAVRADFFGRCAEHPALTAALNDATLLAGPMGTEELRSAIVRPAQARGLNVERELTARILEEVADEPGALPLMSHALMETWRRRRGRTLTMQAYEAAGGLHGAIARTAEDAYHLLTPAQAVLARRILLRLIAPGNGTQDTHRPTPHVEFTTTSGAADSGWGVDADTEAVIDRLARSRLLTLDDGHVRLAHEALITAWPRLLGWINDERDRLRLHRRLTRDATTWHELDRDPGTLYRGTRLTQAQETFTGPHHNELNALETAFLGAGVAARDFERARAARAKRRSRRSMVALAALCTLALVAGTVAWEQKRHSDTEHTQAEARRIATVASSLHTTDPVRAMRLSLAAWNLAHTPETRGALLSAALSQHELDAMPLPNDVGPLNVHLSGDGRTLLYIAKDRVRRWNVRTHRELAPLRASRPELSEGLLNGVTRDGRAALIDAAHRRVYSDVNGRTKVQVAPSSTGSAKFSGNGRTVLTTESDEVQLWDWEDQHLLFRQSVPKSEPEDHRTAVDSNGRYIAACSDKYPLAVWDVTQNHAVPFPLSSAQKKAQCAMDSLQFTPNSHGLLTVDEGHGAQVTDIKSGRTQWSIKQPGLRQVRLSDDGEILAGQDADEILLWHTSHPQHPFLRYKVPNEDVSDLQIDTSFHVIRYLGGGAVRSISYSNTWTWRAAPAQAAQFSPDARRLAISLRARHSMRFQLTNVDNGTVSTELPAMPCPPTTNEAISRPCYAFPQLSFRPDSEQLAYRLSSHSSDEQPVRVWDLHARALVRVPQAFQLVGDDILFSANGRSLLTAIPRSSDIRIWDTRRRTVRTLRHVLSGHRLMARHPDGRSLVVSSTGEKAIGRLLDLRTRRMGRQALTGESTSAVAFSPDGRLLAAGDTNGWVTVWDGEGRRRLGQLNVADGRTSEGRAEGVSAVAFSPDGRTLATAGKKGTVRLWDTASNQPLVEALPTLPLDQVLALAFTTDGKTLRVAGQHTSPQNFTIAPGAATRALCQRAGGGLTPDEWRAYLLDTPYRPTC